MPRTPERPWTPTHDTWSSGSSTAVDLSDASGTEFGGSEAGDSEAGDSEAGYSDDWVLKARISIWLMGVLFVLVLLVLVSIGVYCTFCSPLNPYGVCSSGLCQP